MIWAFLALADPIRIAFVGSSTCAPQLSSMLGDRYRVEVFTNLDQAAEYHPKFIVRQELPMSPQDSVDGYVPDLKALLAKMGALPEHPKVLLCLPSPRNDFDRQVRLPLTVQAARESDAPTVESSDGSAADYAQRLFLEIVDWRAEKADWKIVSDDSEQSEEGPAKNAIDGDPLTYWHTQYSPTEAKYPHELVIDTGEVRGIGGFRCLPRQDGGTNGRVKGYEFWVSKDGREWGNPVAKGDFENVVSASIVHLKSVVNARYIKFRALSEQTGQPYASLAEIDALPWRFAVEP